MTTKLIRVVFRIESKKKEIFINIANGIKLLSIFAKDSILGFYQDFQFCYKDVQDILSETMNKSAFGFMSFLWLMLYFYSAKFYSNEIVTQIN